MPIVLYNSRQLSLITLLTNPLILPAQPAVMMWGGLATVAGLIGLPLGCVLGWVAWLFVAYTIEMVELTATIPYASISLGRVSAGLVWAYYGLLLAGVWIMHQDQDKRRAWWEKLTRHLSAKVVMGGLVIVLILVWVAAGSLPDGKLHVVFFDVGQGDAIFIVSPTGQQVLIDGGPDPATLLARLGAQMPFWDRSLDLVILTHPDDDHLTGLVPVVERYRVGQVFDVGHSFLAPAYARWQELLAEKAIPVLDSRAGTEVTLDGGVMLTVLHPGPSLASTVLKAPHHGSDTSSSPDFLEAVNPQLVVISVGADNPFGHPSPEVLERLSSCPVLRTDERGTIEIIADGRDFRVEPQR